MAFVDLNDIRVSYDGKNDILKDLNLAMEKGELVSLLGPSGCGKTTTLRVIAGLIEPNDGTFTVDGTDLTKVPVHKRNFGMVFQSYALFPHMTVLENLILSPMKTMQVSKEVAIAKAEELLSNLEVIEQKNAYPFSLSGGQKQRVALARAMMIDPKIIGYDEPTSALDPALRDQVANLILENKKLGMTQIVVTHDMDFAEKIADTIIKVNAKLD